MTTDTFNAV